MLLRDCSPQPRSNVTFRYVTHTCVLHNHDVLYIYVQGNLEAQMTDTRYTDRLLDSVVQDVTPIHGHPVPTYKTPYVRSSVTRPGRPYRRHLGGGHFEAITDAEHFEDLAAQVEEGWTTQHWFTGRFSLDAGHPDVVRMRELCAETGFSLESTTPSEPSLPTRLLRIMGPKPFSTAELASSLKPGVPRSVAEHHVRVSLSRLLRRGLVGHEDHDDLWWTVDPVTSPPEDPPSHQISGDVVVPFYMTDEPLDQAVARLAILAASRGLVPHSQPIEGDLPEPRRKMTAPLPTSTVALPGDSFRARLYVANRRDLTAPPVTFDDLLLNVYFPDVPEADAITDSLGTSDRASQPPPSPEDLATVRDRCRRLLKKLCDQHHLRCTFRNNAYSLVFEHDDPRYLDHLTP